jgi:TetR/AcrR family transcriptional regulator
MESFFNLSVEKQTASIDAAMAAFGATGYRKTSISDIAGAAGISKAMVFHYFGTKKGLYLYLIDYGVKLITNEIEQKFDRTITDFFDRILQASEIKVAILQKHPSALYFMTAVFYETNEEVAEDIQETLKKGDDYRDHIAFDGMDTSKFKEGVDVKLIMKMLYWMAEGYMDSVKGQKDFNIDTFFKDFKDSLHMMKANFYKDEYLH